MAFRHLKFALPILIISTLTAVSVRADSMGPQQVIEQTATVLLGVMKDAKALGFDGRFQRLAPIVKSVFNLPLMAQITAGRYWTKATEDQRDRFVQAFGRMTIATLAARFDGYSGEKFNILGTEEQSPNTALVKTEVVQSDGGKVPINYLLRNSAGEWKVADVYADGSISELAVKTADFSQVLRTGGVDALVDALDKKTASIAEDKK
jgi:phospholipid transport system substrate-binding protein